jgi:N-dimethylarginine dimethylaminohydrolase
MHLDGALCLLTDRLALRALDAFADALPGGLGNFQFIDVSIAEADNLACNVLILDDRKVVVDIRPLERVAREIERHGIEVIHRAYDAVQSYGEGMRRSHHPVRRVV